MTGQIWRWSKGGSTHVRFPSILSVLLFGFLLCVQIILRDLLIPVLPDQTVEVDLEMTSRFFRCVVRELVTKAPDEHVRGRLVPWVSGWSLQVKFEIAGCEGAFLAHRVVSVRFVLGNLLFELSVFRSVQQACRVLPDIILNERRSESRQTWAT